MIVGPNIAVFLPIISIQIILLWYRAVTNIGIQSEYEILVKGQ